ncbi:glycosyltransferase 87 family protein [Eudoraea adriatica]|uniref:glycosyltransferase 87 family protein n=1 Tax=Eudoraea adriatica TaxID=446681 RepID=UPI0003613DAE|nr:glycosyltransferase 87 family protein [Eudoraea adriatica]
MAVSDSLHFSLKDKKGVFKLEILRNRLFWIGLVLKVMLSFLFAGKFLKEAFIPFVTYFFESGFDNPYEFFYNSGAVDAFPYPPFMLYFLGFLGGFAANLSPFLIRIPMLLADIGILLVLSRLLKGKETKLLKYYWLSPVLIYITYIHGQLDVVPIAFLLASSYLLFKKKNVFSAVVLGLGIAAKTNLVLVIPFYVLYLWKNNNEKKLAKLVIPALITALVFFVLNLPYLDSDSFLKMVYANREQPKVWNASFSMIGTLQYYIIPGVYLILLATATRFKRISKDLFLIFIGFSFSVLLIFIPPQPGWYFWILPFFVYFAIRENKFSFLPILILQLAFFAYFALTADSDYFTVFLFSESNFTLYGFFEENQWISIAVLPSLALTFLQTCLLLNVYWIYKWGIKKNLEKKIKNKPFLIGIGGDSGVGKSTLTELLTNLFGTDNMTIIRGDDMHKWERGHDKWDEITHLSPKANHLYEDISHLKTLKDGKKVLRRFYDHDTGKFTAPSVVYPNKVIVFEGLHPFYISAKRNLFDLKVFIEPEESLRLHWKISRDIQKRDYTKEKVLYQLRLREEDSNKYIRSQAPFSDIKVAYYAIDDIADIGNGEDVELALRVELETNIDINDLLDKLRDYPTLQIAHDYGVSNQVLNVRGTILSSEIKESTYGFIGDYDEFIEDVVFQNDLNGFLQLFFVYCIVYKAKNKS